MKGVRYIELFMDKNEIENKQRYIHVTISWREIGFCACVFLTLTPDVEY